LQSQKNAIGMLRNRVALVLQFAKDMESGVVEKDYDLMLQISSLCTRLPTIQSKEFILDFNKDYNDAVLISYLSMITKSMDALNGLCEKTRIAGLKRSRKDSKGERMLEGRKERFLQ
jgi:COP9 signalosome complex subunit 6